MGVTEIVFLPLKKGQIPDDPDSTASQAHDKALAILLAQPGTQRAYWGRQAENEEMMVWFVDWDDVSSHVNFTRSDAFKPLLKNLGSLLNGSPTAYHARFAPHPPRAALSGKLSPATEIVTMWFPTSCTPEDQQQVVENVQSFVSVLEKEAATFRGSAAGWVDEAVDVPGLTEQAKAYVLLVGWTSVEAHKDFSETQVFKDNIHHIMDCKGLKKIEAVHANLTEVVAGSD